MRYLILLCLFFLCSCSSTTAVINDPPQGLTFTRLYPVKNWQEAHSFLETTEMTYQEKTLISSECGFEDAPKMEPEGVGAAVISALVGAGIKLGVEALDKSIQKELKEYSAEYKANYVGHFQKTKCWRLVRAVRIQSNDNNSNEKNSIKIKFDALFAMSKEKGVTLIRPVRVLMSDSATKEKSTDGKYGVALSISIKTTAKDGFGHLVESLVLKSNLTLSPERSTASKYFYSYPTHCSKQDDKPLIYCSNLAVDTYMREIEVDSPVEITATVAEVGSAPKFLKAIASVFSSAKEDIGEILAEAAAEKIDPEEDD
ncbi:hypothetical protein [Shewanella sp. 10N.286.52.B9]|uniref:hypothetical protein n=1 Tax=Shewanella sp. 10N.286.52.B9 TaxID=1880837 RepID=UPI000C8195AD|nr:hypothetical protein [Shewanella sp. 10N.286.52.B9]PMG43403.1 hypothetical protein BCU91_00460 [Shewanella sp. 10N.286.52.B9]